MTPIAIYNLVIRYGQKAGIDTSHYSPHSLRATAATQALLNGVDIRKVQYWLGHASIPLHAERPILLGNFVGTINHFLLIFNQFVLE